MLKGLILIAVGQVAIAGDLDAMQGRWVITRYVENGKEADADRLATIALRVRGDRSSFSRDGMNLHGRYVLDEGSDPKGIDIYLDDGADSGKRMLGIYKLEGEGEEASLVICHGPPNGPRPKSFASEAGSGDVLEVWKRKKER